MNEGNNHVWQSIIKQLGDPAQKRIDPIKPQWLFYYDDGYRKLVVEHNEGDLKEILQMFEDFCKGAGFVFDGFAIVDEDGIPAYGLNPIAKLESDGNENTSS